MDLLSQQIETYLLWQKARGQKHVRIRQRNVPDVVAESVEKDFVLPLIFLSDVSLTAEESELLRKMAAAIHVPAEEYAVEAVTDLRAADLDQIPSADRLDAWHTQFLASAPGRQALALVPLGALATRVVLGKGSFKALRGVWRAGFLPTFHPRDLLRFPQYKAQAWQDLQTVMARLQAQQNT